jgi:preprotein translocase subunit SecD
MRRRSTRLSLLFIFLLTAFSVIVVWPSDPYRYLPDFIPWPKEECVWRVCVGKGVDLPYIGLSGGALAVKRLQRDEMLLGLDLRGGTRLVLEADITGQLSVDLDEALDSAVEVVERRVNAFGVAESITERVGSNRIAVQLPGISAEEALEKIGRTAQLAFMELACDEGGAIVNCRAGSLVRVRDGPSAPYRLVPVEEVLQSDATLQASEFKPVTAVDKDGIVRELTGIYLDRGNIFVQQGAAGLPELVFGMTKEGADLLEQATARLSAVPARPMAFFLDGEPIRGTDERIIAPITRSTIRDQGVITGLNLEDAQTLSTLLRTGAFPIPLRVVQQEDVDATLGDTAVTKSVEAGLIAITVVMLFMVLYYRLPGVMASLALFVYVSLVLMVFKLWPVTVTSAGMAAFVLSVGMAVDANILIFERMKEELRLGRSLVNAIDAGFRRAWTSIRDSNVSTLITCFILYWFGDQFAASLVKGFALTLGLGVVVSMFSAIVVTRTFLNSLIGTGVMRHLWLFGSDVEAARGGAGEAAAALSPAGGSGRGARSPER